MDKKDLKSLIEKIVREEFLDEMSGTGAASGGLGPPQVPHAFAGDDKKKSVGWRGKEFGEKSMPNPDERRTNAVDDDQPATLREVTVRESPSQASHLKFPISKEIKDLEDSVKNYKNSEQEKFVTDLKGKLQGKSAKFVAQKGQPHEKVPLKIYVGNILDVKSYTDNWDFYVVLITDDGKFFISSEANKNMLIYGDQDNPTTDRLQRKGVPNPTSQNKVKF